MRAATYVRSSKDRHDVSLDAQRRELHQLAAARGFDLVAEFADAVESGKTDDRPGFQALLDSLKNNSRGWSALLVYDTSRLARRRYIAQALKHEARKRGVVIHYAKLPQDLDPIAEVVLESVFEAMDEVHSLMSREKGMAGMRENVRRGFRAGGRAPIGYRLEHHATGTVRDGKPVTKSRLVPSADADQVRRFLQGRAAGRPRTVLARELGLPWAATTLVHVEWNALTYAGHTAWNVHAPTGKRRRPREEWHVTRDTHPALITEAEAEALLARLTTSVMAEAVSRGRARQGDRILAGLLVTPDGQPWRVQGDRYRLRPGRLVAASKVEGAVLTRLRADLSTLGFWQSLIDAARRQRRDAPDASQEIARLERERARAASLAAATEDPAPFLAIVQERTRSIDALRREAEARRKEAGIDDLVARTTPAELAEMVLAAPAKAVAALVDRVVLAPDLASCTIEYRAPGWRPVASPRQSDRSPLLAVRVNLR